MVQVYLAVLNTLNVLYLMGVIPDLILTLASLLYFLVVSEGVIHGLVMCDQRTTHHVVWCCHLQSWRCGAIGDPWLSCAFLAPYTA